MTNLECVVAILAAHREARMWDDAAVAADLVAQLGLKPDGNAANAKPVVAPGITEDEVKAHEAAAAEAVAKAKASREALIAQNAGRPVGAPATPAQVMPAATQAQQAAQAAANPPPFVQPHQLQPMPAAPVPPLP
jgi:hypothetical protein